MKTTAQILREALELISVPERWTKGASARDIYGNIHTYDSKVAVCWCTIGALSLTAGSHLGGFSDALFAIWGVTGPGDIAKFNDTHTHPEVLAMFDKAIAAAEKAETK